MPGLSCFSQNKCNFLMHLPRTIMKIVSFSIITKFYTFVIKNTYANSMDPDQTGAV